MSTEPDRIPDQLPNIDNRRGRCPHCGGASNFDMREGPLSVEFDPHGKVGVIQRVGVLRCPGCNKGTVVLEEAVVTQSQPTAPVATQSPQSGPIVTAWRGILWWPVPGAADLDPDIPEPVASAYSEGAQQAGSLYKQLKKMAEEQTLHVSLVQWAAEIRLVGNAGAHPEALDPVTPSEAQDLARLCRQLLAVVYETPARIRRARASS